MSLLGTVVIACMVLAVLIPLMFFKPRSYYTDIEIEKQIKAFNDKLQKKIDSEKGN